MANTVNNPGIPYVVPIPGGLTDGMQIHLSGTPEDQQNEFLISLQCGGSIDPRSDCALVFNARFPEKQVFRNSWQKGSWGKEETGGNFPFSKRKHCKVTILVEPDKYSVSVNGHHFCDFNHRIEQQRVTHIAVDEGFLVKSIRFEPPVSAVCGSSLYTAPEAPRAPRGYPVQPKSPIYNPPTPFVMKVGGLNPNKLIFISGSPSGNPTRFTVYLQRGSQFEPHEVAMCFDARFVFGNDRNTILSNHKLGVWGREQRNVLSFPFTPNTHFDMIILVEHNCFKAAVNNQHLVEFRHRIKPIDSIDTLRIDGDVRLTQIRVQ